MYATPGGVQDHWEMSKEKGQPAVPVEWACYLRLDMVLCVGEYGEH